MMKKIIFLLLFITISTSISFAQSATLDSALKIYFEDSLGNKDTLYFGTDFYAGYSENIDINLGEIDLFGQPKDALDVRSILRTQTDYECVIDSNGDPIYYTENRDYKIDFRFPDYVLKGMPNDCYFFYWNYEIEIYAENYPITYTVDTSEFLFVDQYASSADCTTVKMYDNNCDFVSDLDFFDGNTKTITNPNHQTIMVTYAQGSPMSVDSKNKISAKIYPNPVVNLLQIESEIPFAGSIQVYDVSGKLVLQKKTQNTKDFQLDITSFPAGLYLLKVTNNGETLFLDKFIKKLF